MIEQADGKTESRQLHGGDRSTAPPPTVNEKDASHDCSISTMSTSMS